MKKFLFGFGMLALGLSSCSNNNEKASTPPPVDTAKVVEKKAEFQPFDMVEIDHTVKDYAKWRPAFNGDTAARAASGLEFIVIGRGMDNPNSVAIYLKATDVQKAKDFAANPRLKDLMQKNGVISKPDISYQHVIRFNPDSKEKQWVVIKHKVKDFDNWVKTYDSEGVATRASFGLVDVVLARGIDDPAMVYIVFDITDMAKAKARMGDPALKKLMEDAGVEGKPEITFYTTAE